MPILDRKLTDSAVPKLTAPEATYLLYWCPATPGLAVKVTAAGGRTFVFERRVNGSVVRRKLGAAAGRATISCDTARKLALVVSGELELGHDRASAARSVRKAAKAATVADALTLEAAVRKYVAGKRRGDGLALKPRTQADYVAMVEAGHAKADGGRTADGELHVLAATPLHKITGADIRAVYKAAAARSQRQAVYALQVLRAVLNWHGVQIEGSPIDRRTAGRDRIVLTQAKGRPNPIPRDRLGAWWRAACTAEGSAGLRFALLTGCRPGEVFGSTYETGITRAQFDPREGRVTLTDTKNRRDHTVLLSKQARAIAEAAADKKRANDLLFPQDPGNTLAAINAAAGVEGITAHDLRATFASIAESLCSVYVLKRMMNHAGTGDVTGEHYIGKSATELREGWQAVADFIDAEAAAAVPQTSGTENTAD